MAGSGDIIHSMRGLLYGVIMGIQRFQRYPHPGHLKSIEDVNKYLPRLVHSLQEETVARIEDFDLSKMVGSISVASGGTGISSYTIGDLIYASATTTLAKLADVSVGSYLRSGGVTTAPLWSTLKLPDSATAYKLPVVTSTDTIGELTAVGATGEYLKGNTGRSKNEE